MDLNRRLSKLELAAAEIGVAEAHCPACGGPTPGYDLLVLVVDQDGRSLDPVCCDCGLRVDDQGRSRWGRPMPRSGEVVVKKIVRARRQGVN